MARKPRDYKAEYDRRIASAKRRGKSQQAARGHKAREHVPRKAREMERAARTGQLTSAQIQKIKRYLRQQAARFLGGDADQLWDDYSDYFQAKGWSWFLILRGNRDALVKQGYGAVGTLAQFEDYVEMEMSDTRTEAWMMYYH